MAGFTLILHGLATRHIYHYFNSSLRLLNAITIVAMDRLLIYLSNINNQKRHKK
jgi:AcrR family transcriptional regulator